MTMLVILLPARPNSADAAAAAAADAPPAEWTHVFSADGIAVTRHGRAPADQLPKADQVVAVVPSGRLAWQRPVCPKAPANRLRAALGGVLEEQLLDDDESLHLALQPRPATGQPAWVAVLSKPWLSAQLAALAAGGVTVERVVPAHAPGSSPPLVHFFRGDDDADTACWVAASDTEGAMCLPVAGSLARGRVPGWQMSGARFSATPAAATIAERWLGQPVLVITELQHAVAAAGSDWNLLQFDLALRHRGTRMLALWGKRVLGPEWRPVRWGLAALLAAQVLGLNLWAWHQQRTMTAKRESMNILLKAAHPQVRAVLDAPVQMKRETDALREAAGVPGEADLEPLLAAAAMAWPEGQPPAAQLRYEPGRLSLAAPGWPQPLVEQMRQRLQAGGWSLDNAEGRLTISRAARQSGAS